MKTTFKDNHINIYGTIKIKQTPNIVASASSKFLINNQERPLKMNQADLSFKGLSFTPLMDRSKNIITFNKEEIFQLTDKYLGSSARDLYNDICIAHRSNSLTKNMVHVNGNNIQFSKKSVFQLVIDGMVYPFVILPTDIINATFSALKKVKPIKKWATRIYQTRFLKESRQRSKMEAKINALRGIFETVQNGKNKNADQLSAELFEYSGKMFDLKTGNYDTKHERSLNRVVSGMIPACFLANDAYNLSMMWANDKETAKKEQKTRFRQEISRVGLNAYIQLVTLGAIQKYINSSSTGVMLNTALTTLFTESFARISNGKHITKLTPAEAKQINAKTNNLNKGTNDIQTNSTPKTKDPKFKSNQDKNKIEKSKSTDKKPLLSFNSLLKLSAASLVICYAIKGANKIKFVNKMFKSITEPFTKLYKTLTVTTNNQLKESEFNKLLEKLRKNGFDVHSNKYKEVGNTLKKDGFINLGAKDRKIKPLVNFVIAPFKFILSTLQLPYNISEKLIGAIKNFGNKEAERALTAKEIADKNLKTFKISIEKLQEASNKMTNEEFKDFVNTNLLKGFNLDNISNISNKDLGNLAKTSATAATLWFLMTDNYNMVMLKSNGEDKDGAELKFKERLVQESSRLFYQTLLIDLFNSTFSAQYHNSLLGMSWITATNTLLGEILNRKSVGMPVKSHSRDELKQIEQDKENATGFLKSYYNFMAKLTGKKSLAEQHEQKRNEKAQAK